MQKKIIDKLVKIAGAKNVCTEEKEISSFFNEMSRHDDFVTVSVKETEDLTQIIELAATESVPIYSLKDAQFEVPPESGGIILDFSRMNKIEKIDKRNLTVHIQRGVTWDQLLPELDKAGTRALLPAAATSRMSCGCRHTSDSAAMTAGTGAASTKKKPECPATSATP